MKYREIDFDKYKFTASQLDVVKCDKYPIYVKAGAGTGKTETLINKIIYILENSETSLNDISVISFTNKAIDEMKNRLQESLYRKSLEFKRCGNIGLYNKFKNQSYLVNMSRISTIHSFCEEILREYGLEINCSPNHIISTYSNEVKYIIQDTLRSAFKDKRITEIREDIMFSLIFEIYKTNCNKGIYYINNCYQNVFTPLGVLRKKFIDIYNDIVLKIENHKSENNVITLNDSIEKVNILLKDEKIRNCITKELSFLFIDEYQDTNIAQFNLTKSFIDMGIKVFLVGDDKQAIYGFRGSDIENSIKMSEYISNLNSTELSLTENFRSDPQIINIINSIFSTSFTYNNDKLNFDNVPLLTSEVNTQSEDMPALLYEDSNIVDIVQNLILNRTIRGKPIGYSDIAILCRKNYMVDNIKELFKNVGIPVEVIGGRGFYRAKEIIDIYKYLNYIVYRKEEYKKELKFSDIYKSISNYKCYDFDKFLEDLCYVAQGNSMGVIFDFLIDNSNLYQYYSSMGYYQAISNVEKLKSISYDEIDSDYVSIIKFLGFISDKITIGAEENEATVSDSYREKGIVSLYTVHKAKGLSFPIVIISNMDEPLINLKKLPQVIMKCKNEKIGLGFSQEVIARDDIQYRKLIDQHITELLEEEIRIFYVACTRAKHILIFSCHHPLSCTLKSNNASWAKWLLESKVIDSGEVYMNKEYVNNIKSKFLKNQPNELIKEELLSLILSYVDPHRNTNELAKALLKRFGTIRGLLDADVENITLVENIGLNSAVLIKTYTEMMRTYLKESQNISSIGLTNEDIENLVRTNLMGRSKENMFLILMNEKYQLIYSDIFREGSINSIDIYIDEIVRLCIKYKAVYVIVANNHPSGKLLPSSNDIETTALLKSALNLVNIKLLDHLIFANNNISSLASEDLEDLFN